MDVSGAIAPSDEEAYEDVTLAYDSEMPLVLKTYFYKSAETTVAAASASLDVTYVDGSSGQGVSVLDFGASSAGAGAAGTWAQNIAAVYPTKVISSARVRIVKGRGGGGYKRNCVEIYGVTLLNNWTSAGSTTVYHLGVGVAPTLVLDLASVFSTRKRGLKGRTSGVANTKLAHTHQPLCHNVRCTRPSKNELSLHVPTRKSVLPRPG